MEEESIMDRISKTPSSDALFQDNSEDDESFVPESLRGFLQAADAKLQGELDEVMNLDETPKNTNKEESYWDDDHDGEMEEADGAEKIFFDMLEHEADESFKANLISPAREPESSSRQPSPADELAMAPSEEVMVDHKNLTMAQAQEMAMEGVSPPAFKGRDLKHAFSQVDKEPQVVAVKETTPTKKQKLQEPETSYISSDSEEAEPQPISPPNILKVRQEPELVETSLVVEEEEEEVKPLISPREPILNELAATIDNLEKMLETQNVIPSSSETRPVVAQVEEEDDADTTAAVKSTTVQPLLAEEPPVVKSTASKPEQPAIFVGGVVEPSVRKQPEPARNDSATKTATAKAAMQSSRPKSNLAEIESHLRKEIEKQKAINATLTPPRPSEKKPKEVPNEKETKVPTKTEQGASSKKTVNNLLNYLHPEINRNNPSAEQTPSTPTKPESKTSSATPPLPVVQSESPAGTVSNLLDYLHPATSKPVPTRQPRQQLFKTFPSPQPPKDTNVPTAEITISASDQTKIASSPRIMPRLIPPSAPSPMSTASPSSRTTQSRLRQGHSPLVSPRHRRELTSTDKTIPSRLLQGTSASQGHSKKSAPGNGERVKFAASKPTSQRSGPSSRLLRPTQASSFVKKQQPKPEIEKPKPSKPSLRVATATTSRFMQPTKSSRIKSPKAQADLEAQKKKEKEEERQANRARVRARIEKQRKRDAAKKEKKRETKQKVKSTLDKVRERRERLQEMERERVAQLKAKIAEREEKAKQRRLEIQAKSRPLSAAKKSAEKENCRRTSLPRPRPTIPKTPNFSTDKRLGRSSLQNKEETVPLAASNDILLRSFREDLSVGGDSHASEPRKLTIPAGPKLATTQKYGEKSSVTSEQPHHADDDSVNAWQSGLRSVSSPPPSTGGTPKLTIAKTPHFQPVRQRELPKSTAQKEKEEMEYFNTHPFKARTIEMNVRSTSRSRTSTVKPHKLTTPRPFNLSSSRRRTASPQKMQEETNKTFTARPAPTFPASNGTPVAGFTMKTKRALTMPKPFNLSSSRKSPSRQGATSEKTTFIARPAPKVRNHGPPKSITVHNNRRHSHEPEGDNAPAKKFHARPMPNFDYVKIPVKAENPTKLRPSPAQKEEEPLVPFRAKPVPKSLSTPSIPVKPRDPTKLKSPDLFIASPNYVNKPQKEEEPVVPFRAKPIPKSLSTPTIPVKPRDPTKLRSPDYVIKSPDKPASSLLTASKDKVTFRAKPAPNLHSPPSIPVRQKDPSKLRNSPTKSRSPDRNTFQARPAPIRSPPDISVRNRDPSKLRSPSRNARDADSSLPAPPSLVGSSSASSASLDFENRVDKKQAVREKVRHRMMGKAAGTRKGKSQADSFVTDDSASTGISLDTSMTSSSAAAATGRDNCLLQAAMDKWPVAPASESATSIPEEEHTHSTPHAKGCRDEKLELQSAMDGWLFSSSTLASTPRTANARFMKDPKDAEKAARLAEQKANTNRSHLFEETTQLAAQLQRAVEDELSFEASLNSKEDLDKGYIGQPALCGDSFGL